MFSFTSILIVNKITFRHCPKVTENNDLSNFQSPKIYLSTKSKFPTTAELHSLLFFRLELKNYQNRVDATKQWIKVCC